MRQPSDQEELWHWWRTALAGEPRSFHEAHPQCGLYRTRDRIGYRQYGPWLPVKIWVESPVDSDGNLVDDEQMLATRDGVYIEPEDVWVWCCQHPVSEIEFDALCLDRALEKESA